MVDRRALAVGSFKKMLNDEHTEPRTRKMYHSMNGFQGNSGGSCVISKEAISRNRK